MINRENYLAVRRYMDYIEQVKQNEPNTVKRRRIQLRHLLEWADETPFHNAPNIRPSFPRYLAQHRNDNQTRQPARSTINRTLGVTREFFVWLRSTAPIIYRAITDNWLGTLKASKFDSSSPQEREVFTLEDVQKIIGLSADTLTDWRDQAAIALLFLSGMRVGAFVSLNLGCLDLGSQSVKQWPNLGVRTKNRKAATTHLLSLPDLLAFVQRWDTYVRENLPQDALWYASLNTDGTALTGAKVAGVERRAMVAKGLKRLCKRAGVVYHSPHKLRHGHVVYSLKQAHDIADLKAISQNVMHASLAITDGVYGVLSGLDLADKITGLGRAPSGSTSDNSTLINQLENLLTQLKASN